jgi:hypothetical protein
MLKDTLPNCDICQTPESAVYDAPTKQGPWANMCPTCLEKHGRGDYKNIGIKFELRDQSKKGIGEGQKVMGFEAQGGSQEYWEKVCLGGSNREIICPVCDEPRPLELDASGTFECNCGAIVEIPDGIV